MCEIRLTSANARRLFCVARISWLLPFSPPFADFSYSQLGRRGVWDSSHYTSTWDGVRYGSVGSGFTLSSHARASSPTQGSLNPSIPASEPGSALYYHLTQHDGPGRDVRQQRPTCGEHCYAYTALVNQEPKKSILFSATRVVIHLPAHTNPTEALLQCVCHLWLQLQMWFTMVHPNQRTWSINIYCRRPLISEAYSP